VEQGVRAASAGAQTASEVRRLVTSVGISALGTWSYNVGIAVYAYQETGSTTWVAIATVGRYVPALVITSVGSRWTDTKPRRLVATSADIFCAVVMLLLAVVAAVHGPIVVAIALAALSSGVARIQSAAALASAADLVPESQLARTAATLSTTDAVATAVGPALASLVLVVSSPAVLFALNGVTFAVSAALVGSLRSLPATAASTRTDAASSAGGRQQHRAALRLVWPLLALRSVAALVYGFDVVVLAVIATNQLKQGTGGYGWLLTAAGAGGLVAAWWIRSRGDTRRVAGRSTLGMIVYTLPLLGFIAAPLLPGSLAIQLLRGVGVVLVSATVVAGLQRAVPSAAAGRVFGLSHVLVMVGTSVGALTAPLLLDSWGLTTTLEVAALAPLVATLAVVPALRRFDRDAEAAIAALDPRVDTLRRLSLFRDASRSTLYVVADQVTELDRPAGITLVEQGETSDALYVLVSGSVDVHVRTPKGTEHLRTMDAPAYFGEIGLIHGVPRTASVVTRDESRLWRIPADVFLQAAGQAGLSGALTEGVTLRMNATVVVA